MGAPVIQSITPPQPPAHSGTGPAPVVDPVAAHKSELDTVIGSHTKITDKSTPVDKSVSLLVDQVYGQNGQAKKNSGDAAWGLNNYVVNHPEAKAETVAALAQQYVKSYNAGGWQHSELQSTINMAGLGKEVGAALDALGKANPTAPRLNAAFGANKKQVALSASQELQLPEEAARKKTFYADLKTINDPKAIAVMEEFEYSHDQNTNRNNSIFGTRGLGDLSTATINDPRWTSITDKDKIIPTGERQKYIDAAKNLLSTDNQPLLAKVTGTDGRFDAAEGGNKSDLDKAIEAYNKPAETKKLDFQTVIQDPYLNHDEGKRWWANHEQGVATALVPLNESKVATLADQLSHGYNVTETVGDGSYSMHGLEKIASLTPDSPEWTSVGAGDQVSYDKRAAVIASAKLVTDPKNADVMKDVGGSDSTINNGNINNWLNSFNSQMKAQIDVTVADQAKDPLLALNGDI